MGRQSSPDRRLTGQPICPVLKPRPSNIFRARASAASAPAALRASVRPCSASCASAGAASASLAVAPLRSASSPAASLQSSNAHTQTRREHIRHVICC